MKWHVKVLSGLGRLVDTSPTLYSTKGLQTFCMAPVEMQAEGASRNPVLLAYHYHSVASGQLADCYVLGLR